MDVRTFTSGNVICNENSPGSVEPREFLSYILCISYTIYSLFAKFLYCYIMPPKIKGGYMFSTNANKYKLFNEDALSLLSRLPNSSIDLILTDPPYNIALNSTGNIKLTNGKTINNDIADWDKYSINPLDYIKDFKRVISPKGNIFIFTSYSLLGKWHEAFDKEFKTFQLFVWHKTTPTESVYKNSFLNSCELVVCLWNKHHTWNFLGQKEMHNFFECPSCRYPEKISSPNHPTQKPLALIEHLIRIASNPNEIVLDPFMGVGSTGEAALNLNRRFIGCDICKDYCDASLKRLSKF